MISGLSSFAARLLFGFLPYFLPFKRQKILSTVQLETRHIRSSQLQGVYALEANFADVVHLLVPVNDNLRVCVDLYVFSGNDTLAMISKTGYFCN
jgi:hypothetical protein